MKPTRKPRAFKSSEWFKPGAPGSRFPRRFPGWISGVYAIRNAATGAILYVGESHTGRLYDTLRRHLARWIDKGEPREAYHRDDVELAFYETTADDALTHEAWLIAHYQPTDNTRGLEEPAAQIQTQEPGDWVEPEAVEWFEPVTASDEVPF